MLSIVTPRSDSYPAVIPGSAPRRSTSVQVALVKSARDKVLPGKLTRSSLAPPNSVSRSRQFSNVTSVRLPLRKFTESSLQSRKVTRRIEAEKACTPASALPVRVTSCQPVSARSVETNRGSRMVTSLKLGQHKPSPLPDRVTSCQPVSARSVETNRVSRMVTSVNLDLRNRPRPNDTLLNAQSRNRQLSAALSSNEALAKR